MKKIAINMSGAIRTFNYCAESIKTKIIEPLKSMFDVHMFGHFWILKDNNAKNDMEVTMKWKTDCEESIDNIKTFGFTEYKIDEYDSEWEKQIIEGCNGNIILDDYDKIQNLDEKQNYKNYAVNCMGMYYKIKKCQELMENYESANNLQFDYVIRMRPDFYWHDELTKTDLDQIGNLHDNNIMIVRDSYCINAKWPGNDKFFMGTSNMMKKYCRIYNELVYFHHKNIRVEGQNMAKSMIENMNLKIIYFGNDKTYDKCTGKFIKHNKL